MTSVSRRTFLGTAAAASVSAVAAPAMAASTSGNNLPAKWDDTVDVVVLGCGGAGMMAACQAHDAGGKVAVYDAGQSPFHTATNLCGGLFTAWGSKMQNADPEGRKDSWQQFAEDIMAYGNYMSLKEPVYCFAKNSGKAFDFLEDAGLAKHHLEPYAGHSRLRAHRQDSFKGRDYIEVLVKQLDKRGIKINHGMGVTKFYYDPATNTVVGVQVGEGDKAKNVKANKGVIMATGGITGTPQSLDRWVPSVAGKGVAIGGPKNDGTAMMVAVRDVGVPLSHMQYIASYPCGIVVNGRNGPYCRWWFITNNGGILVNKNGQRFMNEDALGGLACATIMHLPEKTAYCIWGANRAEAGGPWGAINYPHGEYFTTEEVIERWDTDADGFGIVKADTREEVISKLGLPAATIDTVERYNKMCEAGVDTDFYKTADKLISIGADDGPFYGASFSPGFLTSLGGLRTDSDLRVLDENDQPIEGLFNAGCMIGNFYSGTYTFAMEGMNYGATCITLPYVLGKDLGSGKLN